MRPPVETADSQIGLGFLRGGARPPVEEVVAYIEAHQASFGVEPICEVLAVAPSTYYAARNRQPSARAIRDAELKADIGRVYARQPPGVWGRASSGGQLNREGICIGRCTSRAPDAPARASRGAPGARRPHHPPRPTSASGRPTSSSVGSRPAAPNRLWVADITYVSTWSGFCYTAFVVDVFSRRIVGWRVSATLRTDLALDALEMAIWAAEAKRLAGLVHHSDRGVQYLAIRYTERLAEGRPSPRSAPRATATTTPWPRRSTGSTRPSSLPGGALATVEQVELATARVGRLVEPRAATGPVATSRRPSSRPPGEKRSKTGSSVSLRAPNSRRVAPTTRAMRRLESTHSPTSVHNGKASIKPGAIHPAIFTIFVSRSHSPRPGGWGHPGPRDSSYLSDLPDLRVWGAEVRRLRRSATLLS